MVKLGDFIMRKNTTQKTTRGIRQTAVAVVGTLARELRKLTLLEITLLLVFVAGVVALSSSWMQQAIVGGL